MSGRLLATLVGACIAVATSPAVAEAGERAARRFDDSGRRILLTTPAYRLELGKRNGAVLALIDRRTDTRLVRGSRGCGWTALVGDELVGRGCAFTPRGALRFSYAWRAGVLTLRYRRARSVEATVTIRPAATWLDLRLTLANRAANAITGVHFPADLLASDARAGYAPNYLPGVRLGPDFFTRVGTNIQLYPSRWAFTDFLALDVGSGHLALSGVNPEPSPLAPVALGFLHDAPPGHCSGRLFCVVHRYETWIAGGQTWTSPVVRLHVGRPVEETTLAHRRDNGFDRYRSAAAKVGGLLPTLARAPLVKADPHKGLGPFADWAAELRRMPSPVLLHPVAFQPGGHDRSLPDVLPPDPAFGTTGDLRAVFGAAHALGQLAMPYLNLSWWNDGSPTMQAVGSAAVAARDAQGNAVFEEYVGPGWVVSPHAPAVRSRLSGLLDRWRAEVPADCLFFDQLGARRWLRDFHPDAPSPLAYYDGWLSLLAPYADRCLMVEDGWDRLAAVASGFHGSALMLHREHDEPDTIYGEGNWEPYPLALWLLHDKVLLYQHDLFAGTLTADAEVLLWNLAFGYQLSSKWEAPEREAGSVWLELAAALQRALGPHYAAVPLTNYRRVATDVTETTFRDLVVVANWNAQRPYARGGDTLAPLGFRAALRNGNLVAGAFAGAFGGAALSPGTHYLVVRRQGSSVHVEQPLGADTNLAVARPTGAGVRVEALDAEGRALGPVPAEIRGRRVHFHYAARHAGRTVAGYRVTAG